MGRNWQLLFGGGGGLPTRIQAQAWLGDAPYGNCWCAPHQLQPTFAEHHFDVCACTTFLAVPCFFVSTCPAHSNVLPQPRMPSVLPQNAVASQSMCSSAHSIERDRALAVWFPWAEGGRLVGGSCTHGMLASMLRSTVPALGR